MRFRAESLDSKCWGRECMRPGEDKGSFSIGRGYTQYWDKPRLVCLTRHLQGCPDTIPEPDTELARCCFRPDYQRKKDAPPKWRTCETCGAQVPVRVSTMLNQLPTKEGLYCRHQDGKPFSLRGWWTCLCFDTSEGGGAWDHKPKPHEPYQMTRNEALDELSARLARVGTKENGENRCK